MVTNIFENRDTKLKTVFALGDSLSRSLRKGIELFSIDDTRVSYLTEDRKLITGDIEDDKLVNLQVEDASVFSDEEVFDSFVSDKVTNLVESLHADNFVEASTSLSEVLKTWEVSVKFDRVRQKLEDKMTNLLGNTKIVESEQFSKLSDIKDVLVDWITKNKDALLESEQIVNSVLLANKVATAFQFKKLSYEDLTLEGQYTIVNENYLPVYDIICQQELIKRELLEAKESLDSIWAKDEDFTALAGLIYESDNSKIETHLAKLITKIPYFAFASKAQISTLLTNKFNLNESSSSIKDIKQFVGKIFEMKKPIREELHKTLSKKYGISINNLKEVPSFKTLVNSQISVFEALSRVVKRTALKSVLAEFADFLKTRNGIEILEVNDFVNSLFKDSGVTLSENNLMQYMDFNRVADDVMKIGAVLKMIQGATQNPQMGSTPGIPLGTTPSPMTTPQIAPPAQQPMTSPTPMAGGSPMPGNPSNGSGSVDPMTGKPGMPQDQYPGNESDPATMAAQGAQQDMESDLQAQGAIPQEPTPMAQNQLVTAMATLDSLLQDLQMQLGRAGGDGQQMPMQAGQMGQPGMEPDGDEGIPGEEGEFGDGEEGGDEFSGGEEGSPDGDGEDDVEYVDMTGEDDSGESEDSEEEESAPPPKEDKKKPSKPLNKSKPKK